MQKKQTPLEVQSNNQAGNLVVEFIQVPSLNDRIEDIPVLAGHFLEMICQEMAISPTNLWTMLYRGRMSLRRCLEQQWPETEAG